MLFNIDDPYSPHVTFGPLLALSKVLGGLIWIIVGMIIGVLFSIGLGLLFGPLSGMIPDPMPSYGEGLEPRRLEGGLSGCLLAGVLGGVTGGLFSRRIIEIFGHLGPARSTLGFAGGLTIAGVLALVMISRNLDRAGRGLAREDLTTVGGMLLVGSILIGLISQMEWAHGSFNAANLVLALTLGLAFGLILGVVHLGRRRLLVAPQSPVELVANSGKIGLVAGGVAGGLIGLAQHYSVGLGFPGLAPGMFGLVLGLTVMV